MSEERHQLEGGDIVTLYIDPGGMSVRLERPSTGSFIFQAISYHDVGMLYSMLGTALALGPDDE